MTARCIVSLTTRVRRGAGAGETFAAIAVPGCGPAGGVFFFFNDTATTEIYTLSLHDALPISAVRQGPGHHRQRHHPERVPADRKSTRLNSSHSQISYAVFCLKKKNNLLTTFEFSRHRHSGYFSQYRSALLTCCTRTRVSASSL